MIALFIGAFGQMAGGGASVRAHETYQRQRRGWPDAASTVCSADLERDSPLVHQHTVSRHQRCPGLIDVRRFGRDPVQLDDFEATAFAKGVDAGTDSHVEPPEVEAVETAGNLVEAIRESRRQDPPSIQEHRAAAVRTELDERNGLTGRGNV